MKKIISFGLALVLLLALAVPAWAEVFVNGSNIPDGTYEGIGINGTVTVTGKATISDDKSLVIGYGSTLVIGSNGSLEGMNTNLNADKNAKIRIESGGKINITFTREACSGQFATLLTDNGYKCMKNGNEIIYPVCAHENTDMETTKQTRITPLTTERKYCKDCNEVLDTNTVEGETIIVDGEYTPAGSTISEGNSSILLCVAALAVGLTAGIFIGRQKKEAE